MNEHIPYFIEMARTFKGVLKQLRDDKNTMSEGKYEQARRGVNDRWKEYCKKTFNIECPLELAYLSAKASYIDAVDGSYQVGVINSEGELEMKVINDMSEVQEMPDEEMPDEE